MTYFSHPKVTATRKLRPLRHANSESNGSLSTDVLFFLRRSYERSSEASASVSAKSEACAYCAQYSERSLEKESFASTDMFKYTPLLYGIPVFGIKNDET